MIAEPFSLSDRSDRSDHMETGLYCSLLLSCPFQSKPGYKFGFRSSVQKNGLPGEERHEGLVPRNDVLTTGFIRFWLLVRKSLQPEVNQARKLGFREKKGFKPLNGLRNHTGKKKYTRSLDTETIIFSSKQIHIVRMLCNSADGHMRALVTCAPTRSFPPTTLTT